MKRLHQTISILLVILALTGIQVVQASALHDHLDQVADCLLCHYDNNSHTLPESTPLPTIQIAHIQPAAHDCLQVLVASPSVFHSRAPPLHA